jgi:hypothetical protein
MLIIVLHAKDLKKLFHNHNCVAVEDNTTLFVLFFQFLFLA